MMLQQVGCLLQIRPLLALIGSCAFSGSSSCGAPKAVQTKLKPASPHLQNANTGGVDVSFSPQVQNEEVGVTVFLNQVQNINLGIVMLPSKNATSQHPPLAPHFRFLVSALGSDVKQNFSQPIIKPVPRSWLDEPVRLIVRAENTENYTFYASPSSRPCILQRLGEAPGAIVSGGVGPFTGSLVGVYATSNGGKGATESYISRWRYEGLAQDVDNNVLVLRECATLRSGC